ncbi:hypothetical protein ACFE04_009312 [Oxalis oulophora]
MIVVSEKSKTSSSSNKRELFRIVIEKSTKFLFPKTTTSSSLMSLQLPMVKEVVLAADLKCNKCQDRVANVISSITDLDSIEYNVREKEITLTRKCNNKKGPPTKCPV